MNIEQAQALLIKYRHGQCSPQEEAIINDWHQALLDDSTWTFEEAEEKHVIEARIKKNIERQLENNLCVPQTSEPELSSVPKSSLPEALEAELKSVPNLSVPESSKSKLSSVPNGSVSESSKSELSSVPNGSVPESSRFELSSVPKLSVSEKPGAVTWHLNGWLRWAAAAVVLFAVAGVSYLLFKPREQVAAKAPTVNPGIKNDVLPGGNKAILTLDDGSTIMLTDSKQDTVIQQGGINVMKLDDSKLVCSHSKGIGSKVLYNTVVTPRGGQYQVVLSDGTAVWLNAASSLRFPTSFVGKTRQVDITGEAYFEVAKNKALPFVVNVNGTQVEVLGTHFNVNAYKDQSAVKTTLVEGSVKVSDKTHAAIIKPGEQANVNKQGIRVSEADVELAIAWKNGFLSFKSADIKSIMHQVARWYDVDVSYEGNLPQRNFTGGISRNSNLSEVLRLLEVSNINFSLEGKKLIVMP